MVLNETMLFEGLSYLDWPRPRPGVGCGHNHWRLTSPPFSWRAVAHSGAISESRKDLRIADALTTAAHGTRRPGHGFGDAVQFFAQELVRCGDIFPKMKSH